MWGKRQGPGLWTTYTSTTPDTRQVWTRRHRASNHSAEGTPENTEEVAWKPLGACGFLEAAILNDGREKEAP